jgi:hypothetical protein
VSTLFVLDVRADAVWTVLDGLLGYDGKGLPGLDELLGTGVVQKHLCDLPTRRDDKGKVSPGRRFRW